MSEIVRVAIGIIEDVQARYLVTQRQSTSILGGYWELPGGKLEEGEQPMDALKRELFEEIGIEVLDANFLSTLETDRHGYDLVLHAYTVPRYLGNPLSKEGQSMRWVEREALSKMNLLPATRELLGV